jgi:hypothetical protein
MLIHYGSPGRSVPGTLRPVTLRPGTLRPGDDSFMFRPLFGMRRP